MNVEGLEKFPEVLEHPTLKYDLTCISPNKWEPLFAVVLFPPSTFVMQRPLVKIVGADSVKRICKQYSGIF